MNTGFWTNTVWYCLLALITIIQLIIVLIKSKNRKITIALFCSISGMTFTIEVIIFTFMMAYMYYPLIFPSSPFDDGLAGNLFSQFSITATALLIAVLKLRAYWYVIFAMIYGIVEELFIFLGIYKHFWYKTWLTVFGLVIIFWLVKKIYNRCHSRVPITAAFRHILIFFGLFTLYMPTIIWPFKLMEIQTFKLVLPDSIISFSLMSCSTMVILANTMIIIHLYTVKWQWKLISILMLYIVHYLAYKYNLIYTKEGWFLIFTTFNIFGMYLYTYILNRLYNNRLLSKGEKLIFY